MERLTEKVNDYWITNDKAHIYYLDTNESVFVGNAIDRLAELEDVLEKYRIETTEELDGVLKPLIDNGELENWKSANFWKMQTERLKKELAELKQKAIVPKFRIGQEVWFVSDPNIEGYVAHYTKVRHMKIEEISISSIFVERGVMYAGDDWAGISESELFATKEEAEKKLAEIGGKDE